MRFHLTQREIALSTTAASMFMFLALVSTGGVTAASTVDHDDHDMLCLQPEEVEVIKNVCLREGGEFKTDEEPTRGCVVVDCLFDDHEEYDEYEDDHYYEDEFYGEHEEYDRPPMHHKKHKMKMHHKDHGGPEGGIHCVKHVSPEGQVKIFCNDETEYTPEGEVHCDMPHGAPHKMHPSFEGEDGGEFEPPHGPRPMHGPMHKPEFDHKPPMHDGDMPHHPPMHHEFDGDEYYEEHIPSRRPMHEGPHHEPHYDEYEGYHHDEYEPEHHDDFEYHEEKYDEYYEEYDGDEYYDGEDY